MVLKKLRNYLLNLHLFYKVLPVIFTILVTYAVTQTIGIHRIVRNEFEEQVFSELQKKCLFLSINLNRYMFKPGIHSDSYFEAQFQNLSDKTGIRITLMDTDGTVSYDSHFDFRDMENHSDRAEFISAAMGKPGNSIRTSNTLKEEMVYSAIPFYTGQEITGVLRLSISFKSATLALKNVMRRQIISNIIISFIILTLMLVITRLYTNSFRNIEKTAREIAKGNYDVPLPKAISFEMKRLLEAISHMITTIKDQQDILKHKNEQLQKISRIDDLTQLGNRRKFEEFFSYQFELCQRNKHYISFLMMDIDHFKSYNDTLGHPEGDKCLKKVSQTLQRITLRATDLLVRLGGEEFGLLLPEASPDEAEAFAVKIINAMEREAIPHPKSPVKPFVTLSIGVISTIPESNYMKEQLYEKADEALYRAKKNGRNRYEIFS